MTAMRRGKRIAVGVVTALAAAFAVPLASAAVDEFASGKSPLRSTADGISLTSPANGASFTTASTIQFRVEHDLVPHD